MKNISYFKTLDDQAEEKREELRERLENRKEQKAVHQANIDTLVLAGKDAQAEQELATIGRLEAEIIALERAIEKTNRLYSDEDILAAWAEVDEEYSARLKKLDSKFVKLRTEALETLQEMAALQDSACQYREEFRLHLGSNSHASMKISHAAPTIERGWSNLSMLLGREAAEALHWNLDRQLATKKAF